MTPPAKSKSSATYAGALQNTKLCFRDPDIKGGSLEQTPLGLPRAVAGNFATVFNVLGVNGKRYAVKCFTRDVEDQQARYGAVSAELFKLKKPWQVHFDYQASGILVEGDWLPILKMEWIEAKGLLRWLEANLGNPQAIAGVATKFAAMATDLQMAGLAHGDLQHGNLLIDSTGELRLIDYDGMFVPSLASRGAAENGLANYQSPARSMKNYDASLDRFAAWLIYSSLLLLIEDPGLWAQFHRDGEEMLLFGKDDFVNPQALTALATVSSLEPIVASLRTCWSATNLLQIPAFDSALLPTPAAILDASPFATQPADANSGITVAHPITTSGPGGDWLAQHLPPMAPVKFSTGKGAARTTLSFLGLGLLGLLLFALSPVPALGAVLVSLAVLIVLAVGVPAYRSQPEFSARRAASGVLAARRAERKAAEKRLEMAVAALDTSLGSEQKMIARITALQEAAAAKEQMHVNAATAQVQSERKQAADALQQLLQGEATRIREALTRLQDAHTSAYMRRFSIDRAQLSGIGAVIAARLAASGIRTAEDLRTVEISYSGSGRYVNEVAIVVNRHGQRLRIEGLGPAKGNTLRTWHTSIATKARSTAPVALPPAEDALIRGMTQAERQRLGAVQSLLAKRLVDESAAIRRSSQAEQLGLRKDQADGRKAAAAEQTKLQSARQTADRAANAAIWAEQQAVRRRETYIGIRFSRFLVR